MSRNIKKIVKKKMKSKIPIIIRREFFFRIRKKSFIIMTIISPLLLALVIVVPVMISSFETKEIHTVGIIDRYNEFDGIFQNTELIHFITLSDTLSNINKKLANENFNSILFRQSNKKNSEKGISLSSFNPIPQHVQIHIKSLLKDKFQKTRLKEKGLDKEFLAKINADIYLNINYLSKNNGRKSSIEVLLIIGFITAFVIYIFIFVYSGQVMRGVMEEKTGRIVEIIISSIKPTELMFGKIIGIMFVALLQFFIWFILISLSLGSIKLFFLPEISMLNQQTTMQAVQEMSINQPGITYISELLFNIPWFLISVSFIFYFLGGYLLYASLFAAIGAAVDNDADTQQFVIPLILPLIIAFILTQSIVQYPQGSVAFWLSIIPFTSPVSMMVRIPFGVSVWELVLSITILIATFIGSTYLSAKIYRKGVLMYGKKMNYRELWKWIRK